MMKERVKRKIKELEKMQGSVENKNDLKKMVGFVVLGVVVMLSIIYSTVPKWFFCYVAFAGLLIVLHYFCIYFYRKKEKAFEFIRTKRFIYFGSLSIMLIGLLPVLVLAGIGYCVSVLIKKEYVLRRNFLCFLVEVLYYVIFAICLVVQTLQFSSNLVDLFVVYVITIVFEIIFRAGIRRVFITGDYRFYERYKYKSEMDVVSEYVFLLATVIATFYSDSDYAVAFMPILLWYSFKQLKKYRRERKNADLTKKYLVVVLNELEEIYTIYLETDIKDKFVMGKYLDAEKTGYYRNYIEQKKIYIRKKRVHKTLISIDELSKKVYNMPKKKELLRKEVLSTMNDIVRCLQL